MKKNKKLLNENKVEIYRFLDSTRSITKLIAWSMMILGIFFAFIIAQAMSNNQNVILNTIEKDPIILKVWGSMITIPFKFCFKFWIIHFCVSCYMRFIANEMKKVGIVSMLTRGDIGKARPINLKEDIGSRDR